MGSASTGQKRSIIQKLMHSLFSGPAGSIFRGMATIVFGSLIGRVIGIVVLPFLTRMYGPEGFGILAIFISIVTFLAPLVTLRYVQAIPLPKTDAMAMNVLALTTLITLGMSIVMTLCLWLGGDFVFDRLDMEAIAPWWWMIAIGVVGSVTYDIMTLWATRKRDYKIISKTSVLQAVFGALTKVAFALVSPSPVGLMAGQVVNQSGGMIALARRFYGDLTSNFSKITRKRMLVIARVYDGFPKYRLPSQFVLIFSQQAPILFVASFYGVTVAGQLAIAKMLVSFPVNLLSGSMTKAAYGEIAAISKDNPQQIKHILTTVVTKLFFISAFASLMMFFLAPIVLPLFLGSEWKDAGIFASYLALYVVATVIAIPMTAFIDVLKQQGEFLIWNLTRAALIASLIGCTAYLELDPFMFILAYGITMLVFQTGVIARTNSIVDREVAKRKLPANM